ncbi:hypothetical protein LMH87_004457 [Akanthomyces muscarius]|uniref:Secreted protein n=1 Tax=Akanthomyces muscarius TaxID=2231603 RepID=A0A9W8Q3B3_AKAMU|nr:hypothetical protein LMH87_004457 [Akanthomyces muscarius]KAJ4145611.1 hypothetical protein LMH87_004457 [Akanthomyces muscarius]
MGTSLSCCRVIYLHQLILLSSIPRITSRWPIYKQTERPLRVAGQKAKKVYRHFFKIRQFRKRNNNPNKKEENHLRPLSLVSCSE